jgi:hypothetical protein
VFFQRFFSDLKDTSAHYNIGVENSMLVGLAPRVGCYCFFQNFFQQLGQNMGFYQCHQIWRNIANWVIFFTNILDQFSKIKKEFTPALHVILYYVCM